MSFGGILGGASGSPVGSMTTALPNPPSLSGNGQPLDPRDRGLGASAYTTGGGGGAQQKGAPYVGAPGAGTGGASTHNLLMVFVLAEVFGLFALRHLFRNYHGG